MGSPGDPQPGSTACSVARRHARKLIKRQSTEEEEGKRGKKDVMRHVQIGLCLLSAGRCSLGSDGDEQHL